MRIDIARQLALKIIYQIEVEKGYSNLVLDEYINKYREKLKIQDINLISEIVYGVITWKLTIDTIIKKHSKIKITKISNWVLNILRMGVYQIVFLDKIPKSAAVNESVNLCKKYAYKSTSFVNAILRKVEKQDYEELSKIEDIVERYSKQYSMPEWIVARLVKEYEIKIVEDMLKQSNAKPNTTIRINRLKTTKQKIEQELEKQKIGYEEVGLEDFLQLKNIKNIGQWNLFEQGYVTVQDEGAGQIAFILEPKPGQRILDACSAPGGKTTYLAELMKDEGEIIAWDLHEHRTKLVKEHATRLGISIIKTQTKDASQLYEEELESFDKILLDVPCLGLGVMKRKPDIKWQRQPEDINKMTKLQMNILETCSQYLKIGGELVYSTCSILKEENEDIIEQFINQINVEHGRKQEKFSKVCQKVILPQTMSDGFFIAKIRRER